MGVKLSNVFGNYMGYFDIDGKRYWDIRDLERFHYKLQPLGSIQSLPSDSTKRQDSTLLKNGDYK